MPSVRLGLNVRCASLLCVLLADQAVAVTIDRVPVGNGVGVATVSVTDGRLDAFYEASFGALDEGEPTRQLLFDAYV